MIVGGDNDDDDKLVVAGGVNPEFVIVSLIRLFRSSAALTPCVILILNACFRSTSSSTMKRNQSSSFEEFSVPNTFRYCDILI